MRRRTYAQADSNRREFLEAAAAITALPVLGSRVHGVVRRRLVQPRLVSLARREQ